MQRARPINLFASHLSQTLKMAEKDIQRTPLQRLFNLNNETAQFQQTLVLLARASKQLQIKITELEASTNHYGDKTNIDDKIRDLDVKILRLERRLKMTAKLIQSKSADLLKQCDETVITWQAERERRRSDPLAWLKPEGAIKKTINKPELAYYHLTLQTLRKNILVLSKEYLADYASALIAIRKAQARKEDLKAENEIDANQRVSTPLFESVLQIYRLFDRAKHHLAKIVRKPQSAKKFHLLQQSLDDADNRFRRIMQHVWCEHQAAPQVNALGEIAKEMKSAHVMTKPPSQSTAENQEVQLAAHQSVNTSINFTHRVNRKLSLSNLMLLNKRPAYNVSNALNKLVGKLKRNVLLQDVPTNFILMNLENACVALRKKASKEEGERKIMFDKALLSARNKLAGALGGESATYESAIQGFSEEIKAISLRNQALAERILEIGKTTNLSALKKSKEFAQCDAQLENGIEREKQKLVCGRFCVFGSKSTRKAYAHLVELHRRKKMLASDDYDEIKLQLLQFMKCQKENEIVPEVPVLNRRDEKDFIRASALMKESLKGQCQEVSATFMRDAVQVYKLFEDFDQHYANPAAKALLAAELPSILRQLDKFYVIENNMRRMSFQYCMKAELPDPIEVNPPRRMRA